MPPDPAEFSPSAAAAERWQLLREFCALPEAGDVVTWQRHLADAIISAERASNGPERDEAKRHRHLLHVIGDALVHDLVPDHTIRTLSRRPGKPAAIASQGEDFDFVFECAREFREAGLVPILADLTTLIGVGDLLAVGPSGIGIFECKNTQAPARPPGGRLGRQRQRGEGAERYLSSSFDDEEGRWRIAVEAAVPEADYAVVEALLEACLASPSGTAVHLFAERDVLIAFRDNVSAPDIEAALVEAIPDGADSMTFGFAFWGDLIDTSSYRRLAPSSYPLPAEFRWRLLEGDIHLLRLLDFAGLEAQVAVDDIELRLVPRRGPTGLEVVLEGVPDLDEVIFTSALTEMCMWAPISVDAMRAALIDQARSTLTEVPHLIREDFAVVRAPGDSVTYATLYKNGEVREPKPRSARG